MTIYKITFQLKNNNMRTFFVEVILININFV